MTPTIRKKKKTASEGRLWQNCRFLRPSDQHRQGKEPKLRTWLSAYADHQLQLMDDIRHHAPDMCVFVFRDVDFGVVRILRHKQNPALASDKPLHRQFAIKGGNNNLVVSSRNKAVNDQKITVKDSSIDH